MNCADNKLIFEHYTKCILEQINPASFQSGDRFTDKSGIEWEVVRPMGDLPAGLYLDPQDQPGAGGRTDPDPEWDMMVKKSGGDDPAIIRNVIKDDGSGMKTAHDWIDHNSYKSKSSISASEKDVAAGQKAEKEKEGKEETTALWARVAQAVATGSPVSSKEGSLLKGIGLGQGMTAGVGSQDWVTKGAITGASNLIGKIGKRAPKRGAGAVGYV